MASGMSAGRLMFLALLLALALPLETGQGFRAGETLRLAVRTAGHWIYHAPAAARCAVDRHLLSTQAQDLLRSLKLPSVTPRWIFQTGCTPLGELVLTHMDGKVPQPLSPLAKLLPLGIRSSGLETFAGSRSWFRGLGLGWSNG